MRRLLLSTSTMHKPSEGVQVEVSDRIKPIAGVATYRSAEYSLVYRPTATVPELNAQRAATGAWRQNGRRIFVTSGFVTLTFDGAPFAFTELDAYANVGKWADCEIALPVSRRSGALLLADDPFDDDRMSIGEPLFEIDRRRRIIRIGFGEDAETYFEIGSGLLAGVRNGRLTSLTLSAVRFE